jgi:hypothetical protein
VRKRGVVDMDEFEKQGIIEIKITQLALMEMLEGPEVAVNMAANCSSLFKGLFRDLKGIDITRPTIRSYTSAPKLQRNCEKYPGVCLSEPKTSRTSVRKTETSTASTADPATATNTIPTL